MKNTLNVIKKASGIAAYSRLIILLTVCLIFPQTALAAIIADGDYLVQMADSNLAAVSSGMTVMEQVTLGQNEQSGIWRFEHLANGYYKVIAPKLAMVLDSSESKKYNGVPIIIFPWHGGRNQRWKVIAKGEFYTLTNQETGLALDLKGNALRVGTFFQGYVETTSRGQFFRLTPMDRQNPPATVRDSNEKPLAKSFSNGPAGQ